MKIQVLNQKAGHDPIGNEINKLLSRKLNPFTHVKFLMAFVNKNGLRYIKDELEKQYDNGVVAEFIIGIDNGVTTHEALSYLKKRFAESPLFVFHDNSGRKVFHHKLVIFENEKTLACVIGSANLTLGGMYSNYESAILAEFDKTKDASHVAAIMRTWDAYRNPQKPLNPASLQTLTSAWLKKHEHELRRAVKSNTGRLISLGISGFASTPSPRPKLSAWQSASRHKKPRRTADASTVGRGKRLYVQVLKETGAGGTQVQIPTEALTDYFKGSLSHTISLRIQFGKSAFRDGYIYHFDNDTHRVSIRELANVERPAILLFERLPQYQRSFRFTVLTGKKYHSSLKLCNQQTRTGAKRWGVAG